jgi:arylsulfatase B
VTKGDACVVWGNWRLVHNKELYDVAADRAQTRDLAPTRPEVVQAMREHYEQWWAEVEPSVNSYIPVAHIGSPHEPVVALTSADWQGIYADNTGHIRRAIGGPTGSHWNILVTQPGHYEIVLRRWPRETQAALGAKHDAIPEIAKYGGKNYAGPSQTFPTIASAVVECAGRQVTANTSAEAQEVALTITLPAGATSLKGWFRDANGHDLCGAFFAYIRRVS